MGRLDHKIRQLIYLPIDVIEACEGSESRSRLYDVIDRLDVASYRFSSIT